MFLIKWAKSVFLKITLCFYSNSVQDLKRDDDSTWTSVIKESLEMSNGMELEHVLLADMCGSPLVYDSRVVEFTKNHFDPEDNETDVQEREVSGAQEPTVINSSDDVKTCPLKPTQEFLQKVG